MNTTQNKKQNDMTVARFLLYVLLYLFIGTLVYHVALSMNFIQNVYVFSIGFLALNVWFTFEFDKNRSYFANTMEYICLMVILIPIVSTVPVLLFYPILFSF